MADKLCGACMMEFDWPGVVVQGYEYCCEACSRGEECTCEQYHHDPADAGQMLNMAGASQLGTPNTAETGIQPPNT
jgi:hypothetical protein